MGGGWVGALWVLGWDLGVLGMGGSCECCEWTQGRVPHLEAFLCS